MKRALVTGANGFVGRHLVPKLEAAGYVVTGCDKHPSVPIPVIFDQLSGESAKFDVIFHLAANIEDVDSRIHGGHRAYGDILLDYQMAEFASRFPPCEALVVPTSCAVDFPDDPYAWVKLTAEKIFCSLKNVNVKMLRPFSGYGESQALSYPFPAILRRALDHEDPLTVWGTGTQVRDFIHIDDLSDAFLWAVDHFPSHRPIQIGTGVGTNFLQLARMIADEVGYDPQIKCLTEKASSSPRRVANHFDAAIYGFETKVTLSQGIKRAVKITRVADRLMESVC